MVEHRVLSYSLSFALLLWGPFSWGSGHSVPYLCAAKTVPHGTHALKTRLIDRFVDRLVAIKHDVVVLSTETRIIKVLVYLSRFSIRLHLGCFMMFAHSPLCSALIHCLHETVSAICVTICLWLAVNVIYIATHETLVCMCILTLRVWIQGKRDKGTLFGLLWVHFIIWAKSANKQSHHTNASVNMIVIMATHKILWYAQIE